MPETAETKNCPYCAETIKAAAVVCRFCDRELPGVPAAATPPVVDPVENRRQAALNVLRQPLSPPAVSARPASSFAQTVGGCLALVLACCLLFGGCFASTSPSPVPSATPSLPEIGQRGSIGTAGDDKKIPAALSAESYNKWAEAEAASDDHGKKRLLLSGQVVPVVGGTPATYLKYDWGCYQVRVTGGAYDGERVWVAEEFFKE